MPLFGVHKAEAEQKGEDAPGEILKQKFQWLLN